MKPDEPTTILGVLRILWRTYDVKARQCREKEALAHSHTQDTLGCMWRARAAAWEEARDLVTEMGAVAANNTKPSASHYARNQEPTPRSPRPKVEL
jgi:hypothetical protein